MGRGCSQILPLARGRASSTRRSPRLCYLFSRSLDTRGQSELTASAEEEYKREREHPCIPVVYNVHPV